MQDNPLDDAIRISKAAPPVRTSKKLRYAYKMVPIPQLTAGIDAGPRQHMQAAAEFLESAVEKASEEGWEFFRVDSVPTFSNPGPLTFWDWIWSLLPYWQDHRRVTYVTVGVITFRKEC